MKNIQQWLDAYGESHQNKLNKMIHWVCVPLIMLSLLGILSLVKFSIPLGSSVYCLNIAHILVFLSIIFYIRLSFSIMVGMILISIINLYIIYQIEILISSRGEIFNIYLGIFILSWIGQFIGHKIEGKKPSFFEDLQFLLIGPLWLLAQAYKSLGIKY